MLRKPLMKRYSHDSDPDIPSYDALKQCFDENLGTFLGKLTVGLRHYDLNGVGYFGYQHVTWAEIEARKPIVSWFDGFNVTWTDVIQTAGPGMAKLIPIDILSADERARVDKFFDRDRKFTGSRNEVRAICAK